MFENVSYPLKLRGSNKDEMRSKVAEVLAKVVKDAGFKAQ